MSLWHWVFREITYRKVGFAVACVAVAAAMACLVGSVTLLEMHDHATQSILAAKAQATQQQMDQLREEMRVAMLKLGLNLVILPKGQDVTDWYADHRVDVYMDESEAEKLTHLRLVAIRHILPILQQPVRWPEMQRKIILIGTRGETPDLHKNPKKPIIQPVPKDTIVLGYELHRSLGLKVDDRVQLMGKAFTVHNCHAERGTRDDITAWIELSQAQELLAQPGKINAILALQCVCSGPDLSGVRAEITRALPNTKVLELGAERRLARAEARASVAQRATETLKKETQLRENLRTEREGFASLLVTAVVVAAGVWLAFLAFANARQRRSEIGILRALGHGTSRILSLFLARAVLVGLLGGVVGCLLGALLARTAAGQMADLAEHLGGGLWIAPDAVLWSLPAALLLSAAAAWLPAILAAMQDPADVLREE